MAELWHWIALDFKSISNKVFLFTLIYLFALAFVHPSSVLTPRALFSALLSSASEPVFDYSIVEGVGLKLIQR